MLLRWHEKAWEEYLYYQSCDKKTLKKINDIIKNIDRNGYNIAYNLEPLKGNLNGFYSVRIDQKNRIVFRIVDNTLEIIQCGQHYND